MIREVASTFGTMSLVLAILLVVSVVVLGVWLGRLSRLKQNHKLLEERSRDRDARLGEQTATITALRRDLRETESRLTSEFGRAEGLEQKMDALETMLTEVRDERANLGERHRAAQAESADLRVKLESQRIATIKDRDAAEKEIHTLREVREEMARQFRELAAETLRVQGEDFSKASNERLSALLAPFKDHVGRFQDELRVVHKSADEERARLKEQIFQLHQRSEKISQEAVSLTRALKGDKQRQGAWGEMILERILEDSGLERGLHYEVQQSQRDEEGRSWRPDVLVKLPKNKSLIIDSKVSLVDYEAAVNSETEEERTKRLMNHVRSVERHIDMLSAKEYHSLAEGSVDYVLMFVPIEGALSEALRIKGALTSYALQRGVGIMTPTTLMVALRTVEHIWAVERRESNAEEIADRAGKLYDKICGFVTEMEKVGDHLRRATEAHGTAVDRLSRGSGNVLGQVEKLKKLGAKASKSLPISFDEDGEASALPLPAVLGSTATAAE